MKPAVLEGGILTIAREAIEAMARRKGFDLHLILAPTGVEAAVTVPAGILSLPAKVTLKRIRAEGTRLVGDDLTVSASLFPIPLSLLSSYVAKYPFLALDADQKKIYLDLKQLLPEYIHLTIKDIVLVQDAIKIHLGSCEMDKAQYIL